METFLLILVGLLGGYFVGVLHERHRLDDFVKREREWATQQTLRADRAVDQLVVQSGGTSISALGQAEQEQREELQIHHQDEQNEIFADETGEDRGPEELPS